MVTVRFYPVPVFTSFLFPFVSPSFFHPSGGTVPFRPFPFPCISFFPGDYLSPAGEPRPTAQARRTIKKHGGGMADVAGICWRTPLSRRTAASRRTFFKSPQHLGCCSNLWGACLGFGMLVEPLGCLSSRWDVDRRYILADAAVAANRRFAAHNFFNPCNLWDVVLTFGELV